MAVQLPSVQKLPVVSFHQVQGNNFIFENLLQGWESSWRVYGAIGH